MVKAANPSTISLPAGVRLLPLQMNRDDRGVFTEVFRRSWDTGIEPVQWNFVRSQAGGLRRGGGPPPPHHPPPGAGGSPPPAPRAPPPGPPPRPAVPCEGRPPLPGGGP